MKIPLEFYDNIRTIINISDVIRQRLTLVRKGNEYLGICPFHDEKTPSFTVNDNKKFYHCFGCRAHGDVIKFVSVTSGISYQEAAIKIAHDYSITLPKMSLDQEQKYQLEENIYNILNLATEFFQNNLYSDIIDYLHKRGITSNSIKSFSIGFAPGCNTLKQFFNKKSIPVKYLLQSGLFGKKEDGTIYEVFHNRIMFPIRNIYNKVVGFGGRTLGKNMPKYINSSETSVFQKSEVMFGENIAMNQSYKANYSIIVEGYIDVITLHQAGFKQAVASLGTSVTEKHLQKLWRFSNEIIGCLDGDHAGIRASSRLMNISLPHISAEKSISFINMPKAVDPDDVINHQGVHVFRWLLENRMTLSEMLWHQEFHGKHFTTAESIAWLEERLHMYTRQIQNSSLKTYFQRYFKTMLWKKLICYSSQNQVTIKNSAKLFDNNKQYSDMEYIENAISYFLCKFPHLIRHSECNIKFQDPELEEVKNLILDLTQDYQLDTDLIMKQIKNTRFYNRFLLSSGSDILFLDCSFLNDDSIKREKVFEWLNKKHYLLLLKNEYIEVLNNQAYHEEQFKAISYLKEIRQVSQEIDKLSYMIVNN